jgi:hypothetical protein
VIPQRRVILALILLAQTAANVGPLGIPAIASLIRADLGLTLTQAGSFISAYDIGPILMSLAVGVVRRPHRRDGLCRFRLRHADLDVQGPLLFGGCVEAIGGYRGPWIGLALTMVGGLALLAWVRERPRADVFVG